MCLHLLIYSHVRPIVHDLGADKGRGDAGMYIWRQQRGCEGPLLLRCCFMLKCHTELALVGTLHGIGLALSLSTALSIVDALLSVCVTIAECDAQG